MKKNGLVVNRYGATRTYKEGKLHSYEGLPSVILKHGTKKWYKRGKLHRDEDKPIQLLV